MIAAVKGWHAVLYAFLVFFAPAARASEDLNGAARELARKTAAFGNRGEPVSVTYRNVSTLGSSELSQARSAYEGALQDAGLRLAPAAPTAVRITLSETPSQYLLVAEIQNGDDRRVWIASWKRTEAVRLTPAGISLERKLIWEQDEQMLDVAFPASGMLVLSPTRLTLYAKLNGAWQERQSAPLSPSRPWPRDLRGRLRVTGSGFQAYLPGTTCTGSIDPSLTVACQPADEPWVIESGSRALLLANFAAARNYFDGRVVTQSGVRKQVAPFFSAAAADEQGRTLWLTPLVDGRVQLLNSTLDPVGVLPGAWGSDIAGASGRCGGGAQILATRPGDGAEADSVQAFTILERAAAPLTAAVVMNGPVTALWPSGPTAVLAIVRDLSTGKYSAYLLTVVCGA